MLAIFSINYLFYLDYVGGYNYSKPGKIEFLLDGVKQSFVFKLVPNPTFDNIVDQSAVVTEDEGLLTFTFTGM